MRSSDFVKVISSLSSPREILIILSDSQDFEKKETINQGHKESD